MKKIILMVMVALMMVSGMAYGQGGYQPSWGSEQSKELERQHDENLGKAFRKHLQEN